MKTARCSWNLPKSEQVDLELRSFCHMYWPHGQKFISMLRNRKHLQTRPSRSLINQYSCNFFFFFKFCIKIRLQKCQPQPSTAGSQLDLFSTLVNPDFTHLDQDLQVMPKPANPNPTSSTSRLPLSQKHMSAVSGTEGTWWTKPQVFFILPTFPNTRWDYFCFSRGFQ